MQKRVRHAGSTSNENSEFDSAEALFDDLEKTAKLKRANQPRSSDKTNSSAKIGSD